MNLLLRSLSAYVVENLGAFANRRRAQTHVESWRLKLASATKALDSDPNSADAWAQKASAHEALSEWRQAADAYRHQLEFDAENERSLIGMRRVVLAILHADSTSRGSAETTQTIEEKSSRFYPFALTASQEDNICYHTDAACVYHDRVSPLIIFHLTCLASLFQGAERYSDALDAALAAQGVFVEQNAATKAELQAERFVIQHCIADQYSFCGRSTHAVYHVEKLAELAATPFDKVRALEMRGEVMARANRFKEALDAAFEAIRAREANGLPGNPATLDLIATTSFALGKGDEAIKYAARAIELEEEPTIAAGYWRNLSQMLSSSDRFDEASECLDRAVALDGSQQNRLLTERQRAMIKVNVMRTLDDRGEQWATVADQVSGHFEVAEELAREFRLQRQLFRVLLDYAFFLSIVDERNGGRAKCAFEEALALARLMESNDLTIVLIMYSGYLLTAEADALRALEMLAEAEPLHESTWLELKTDEYIALYGSQPVVSFCHRYLGYAHALLGKAADALEATERGRSRALALELSAKLGMQPLAIAFSEMREMAASLNATFVVYVASLKAEAALADVGMAFVIDGDMDEPFVVALDSARNSALSVSLFGKHMRFRCLPRNRGAFDDGNGIRDGKFVSLDESRTLLDKEASEYFDKLWKPIRPHISNEKSVIIFPDRDLWTLPFGLLIDENNKLLLERYTLSFAPSVGVLKLLNKLAETGGGRYTSALIIANPKVEEAFATLPGAEVEADEVAQMLSAVKISTEILRGAEATKYAFLDKIGSCCVLHIAAHGVRAQSAGGYLRGGVVFAGDCVLFPEELQALDLRGLKLAVLSSCHSGTGNVKQEGLLGLGRALMFAGCRCVLLALWQIPDRDTRLLIGEFYRRYLAGDPAPLALREAQLTRQRAGSPIENWGAFIVLGV